MKDPHDASEVSLEGLPVPGDAERFRARVPLEILVSRFADAVRRGERPSIDEFALRYRDWAEQIRELFPLIESLERWKLDKEMECLRRNVPIEFPVRQLGDYRIVRELGRGGMGIVFEAVHQQTGRHDAVKLLPWRYAADMAQWKERFQREAATIARLRHPNIVRVYSFGTDEGYCYYAMQLVVGVSLDAIIRRLREADHLAIADEIRRSRWDETPAASTAGAGFRGQDSGVRGKRDKTLAASMAGASPTEASASRSVGLRRDSWKEFAQIAKQVALALGHAHESGVRHNDVKPANLLLEASGQVIVTDFGIGRRRDDDLDDSDEHAIGTVRYMAPERLFGSGDTRSDIYALGATLYELCTLRPAFDAPDRRQLAERILETRPAPPREIVREIPPALETIILNAMAPNPADRYPFAEAFAADLLRFVNGRHVSSTRPGFARRAWRALRRRVSESKRAT